ncbi:hypothetical protein [Rhabdaerophilum sp.]|uniref:hypothetical protein n=1 Tax=Rhabdaerophilum sp. TaxID=2717341 RepID=UPI0038D4A87D
MPPSRSLEARSVPGTFERLVHWVALASSFLLLGGIVVFSDLRRTAHSGVVKQAPAIEASR